MACSKILLLLVSSYLRQLWMRWDRVLVTTTLLAQATSCGGQSGCHVACNSNSPRVSLSYCWASHGGLNRDIKMYQSLMALRKKYGVIPKFIHTRHGRNRDGPESLDRLVWVKASVGCEGGWKGSLTHPSTMPNLDEVSSTHIFLRLVMWI